MLLAAAMLKTMLMPPTPQQTSQPTLPVIPSPKKKLGQTLVKAAFNLVKKKVVSSSRSPSEGDPASVSINETKTDVGCWGEITEEVGPVILSS